jgi:tRNA(adenine34) deaminase
MNQEEIMKIALEEAKIALKKGELPVGAVLATEDRVIIKAHNQVIGNGLLWHAEFAALQKCDDREFLKKQNVKRSDMKLYTTLEPCFMCYGAAMNFHLNGIVYGLESPDDGVANLVSVWKRERGVRSYFKPLTAEGAVLRDECQVLFREFAIRYSKSPFANWAKELGNII